MTRRSYQIKVIGSLGPAAREAFTGVSVEVEPAITVLSGDLDQGSLHALLDRVRALGLELVEIKQASSALPPARPGRESSMIAFPPPPRRVSSWGGDVPVTTMR